MIILAAAIIISLSNNGIIGKANQAVKASDLKAVQNIATLAWAEVYLDGKTTEEIKTYVKAELAKYKVTDATHNINFTENGVEVLLNVGNTLGNLITAENYGDKINNNTSVEVTSDGLYVLSDGYYWLASPSAFDNVNVMMEGCGSVSNGYYSGPRGVRPVVCLKSDIPAVETADGYSLVK